MNSVLDARKKRKNLILGQSFSHRFVYGKTKLINQQAMVVSETENKQNSCSMHY